jgi:diguanylate cyclase (GGDEF)-like protein
MSFVREFPHITNQLTNEADQRQIPRLLLYISLRCFNPWQAVVFLRRHRSETEPLRNQHLVVAAVARSGQGIELGQQIRFGQGLIGAAAETQRIFKNQKTERQASLVRDNSDPDKLLNFAADLVAPMVFRGETVGVIALSEMTQVSEAAIGTLRVICQMGALAVYNASAYGEMKTTAQLDGLTQLYNKSHITSILSEKICEAEERQTTLSVFMFDIDHFKNYNDTNGHDAGDKLLKELSKLIQENVRKDDYVGRFGGEEFLLVLPNTQKKQAGLAAENIRKRISNYPFAFANNQPLGFMSISGGVANYPKDGLDTMTLLRAADEALYQSKREGRNRTTLAEPRHVGSEDTLKCEPAKIKPYKDTESPSDNEEHLFESVRGFHR